MEQKQLINRLRRRSLWTEQNKPSREAEIARHRRESRLIMASRSYPRYLLSTLRRSSAYRIWMRILTYFRRFRLVSVIIRVTASILTIIETSALLIMAATVFIVALPPALMALLIFALAALVAGSRCNRRLTPWLRDKQIFVFFPTEQTPRGGVLHATLIQLASKPGNAVFAVSPYPLSPELFGQNRPYFIQTRSAENIFYIRKYYFFMLRRGVLSRRPVRYIF